jgi:hypothetical protein
MTDTIVERGAQALQDHMEQRHGVCLRASEWDAAARAVLTAHRNAMSEGVGRGKVVNCYVESRGEVLFTQESDGSIIANLDGYSIIPTERHEALQARLAEVTGHRNEYADALDEAKWLFAQIAQNHTADSAWLETAMATAKKGYELTRAALSPSEEQK